MRKTIGLVMVLALLIAMLAVGAAVAGKDDNNGKKADRALVCHNGNSIEVNGNSVGRHLGHGDYLGECEATDP